MCHNYIYKTLKTFSVKNPFNKKKELNQDFFPHQSQLKKQLSLENLFQLSTDQLVRLTKAHGKN
jgi:hypothetical protein